MTFDIHPQLVHFPIVLITVSFILYLIGYFRKNRKLFTQSFFFGIAALASGFISAISGERAEEAIDENISKAFYDAIERHELFANITIWFLFPVILAWGFYIGKKKENAVVDTIILFVLGLLTLSILYTGHLGGDLVYHYGAGVKLLFN